MLDPLLAAVLFTTILLGLLVLHLGAAAPVAWFFFSWILFNFTALVGLLDPSYRWLSDSYVIYGSLAPPLTLGGTLILLSRPVPSWLLPAFLGVGVARFGILELDFPTLATAGALAPATATGVAAYFVLRDAPRFASNRALRVLGPALALFTLVAVGSVVALTTLGSAAPAALLRSWLLTGLVLLGCQLWAVSEQRTSALRRSRDALERQVEERTAELAQTNASLQREVEERREAQQALERSEHRYRTVSELSSDFSFSLRIDPETGVEREWVTEAFERITGHPPEALDGRHWDSLFHDVERAASPEEIARRSTRDGGDRIQYRIVRPDGEVRYLDVKLRRVTDPETGVVRVVGAAQDVTDSQVSEEARLELERQVEAAQRVESLGMLTGGIAHDFNNLLAVILGNTRLVQDEQPESSPSIGKLSRIRSAAEHAARLTEQMLTYSGKAIVSLAPIELSGLIHDLSDLLRASVGTECTLRLEVEDDGVIEGDATRLSQVILNLVANANEALQNGRGEITVRTGRCSVEGEVDTQPADYLWFEVSDDGVGMDEETRRRIFEPFFTTKFSGRGLGLASAMGIIRAHGGRVEIESDVGRGTRVRVLLPPSSAETILDLVPKPVDTVPERVLVVDDDEAVLELAEEFLRRAGYDSHRAAGGQEAIELFQKKASEIDVVVLDLTMPDIDGREVFQALRRVRSDVPVVLATGYSRGTLEETFPDETLVSFLRKPYEPEQLLEAIRAASQARGNRS